MSDETEGDLGDELPPEQTEGENDEAPGDREDEDDEAAADGDREGEDPEDDQENVHEGEEDEEPDDDEILTLEHNGETFEVPRGAVKALGMFQADYTKKTQELAESRRAVEGQATELKTGQAELQSRQEAFDQHVQTQTANIADVAKLHAMDEQLEQYRKVDWDRFQQENPDGCHAHWRKFELLKDERAKAAEAFKAKYSKQVKDQEQAFANWLNEARDYAAKNIDGWSKEREAGIEKLAESKGITANDLNQVVANNPVVLDILNLAAIGRRTLLKQAKPPKPKPKPVQPTKKVRTTRRARARLSDKQPTDDWMEQRNREIVR